MILQVSLAALTNQELFSFAQKVYNVNKDLPGLETILNPLLQSITKAADATNHTHQKSESKVTTAELRTEDLLRDNYYVGIRKLTEASLMHPYAKVVDAAEEIKQYFNTLGATVEKKKYDVESLILRNVIATFTGSLSEAIATIHATPYVSALEKNAR